MTDATKKEIIATLVKLGRQDLARAYAGHETSAASASVKAMSKGVKSLLKQAKALSRSKFPLESSQGIKIVGLLRQVEKAVDTLAKLP